ncbi:MAG: type II toxin-antitoxin system Phd/YefM family antitoxin [Candidatus Gracilibacteria bacterium]|jgi:prevent-host-death family protein
MININDEMKLIGATELRTEVPKLINDLKMKTVIVTKRGKPVAVLQNYTKYQEKEDLLDTFEDLVLGHLAKERHEKSQKSDYIPASAVWKKLGI